MDVGHASQTPQTGFYQKSGVAEKGMKPLRNNSNIDTPWKVE
jgi:hypothetical protein